MSVITQGKLWIKSEIPVMEIKEFHMKFQKNCHGMAYVEGIVTTEIGESVLLQPLLDTVFMIGAGEQILFAGILKEMRILKEGMIYQIMLEGVSATEKLDHRKRSRTFQNISMTYSEVMRQVVTDVPDTQVMLHGGEARIGEPLYQIEETDWEFMKRIASRQRMAIIPSIYSVYTGVHIGLPKGKKCEVGMEEINIEQIWIDKNSRCICRRIRTYQNWDIGDWINYEGQECSVIAKECKLEKGLVYFYYTLAKAAVFSVDRYENPYMAGLLLSATVLDVKEEAVKVKFDVDIKQDLESAYWYPWRPDTGNIMYCMPEKGEKVYVYMSERGNKEVRAVCSIHKNGTGNQEMKSTCRYFTTSDKKRMGLTPESIGFEDMKQKSPLEVQLHDNMGVNVKSHHKIVIVAQDTIGIKANNVKIQVPDEISIVRRDALSPTVINMCNGFDSIGTTNEVMMAGGDDDEFPVFYESDQNVKKEYGLEEIEKNIIASTPVANVQNDMDRLVGGIKVDKVITKNNGSGIRELLRMGKERL